MGDLTGPLNFVCPNMCLMRKEWQASRTEVICFNLKLNHDKALPRRWRLRQRRRKSAATAAAAVEAASTEAEAAATATEVAAQAAATATEAAVEAGRRRGG